MRLLALCADPGIPLDATKGAAVHLLELWRALARAGVEVTGVAPARGAAGVPRRGPRLSIYAVPGERRDPRILAAGVEAAALAASEGERPDAVLERLSRTSDLGASLARRFDVPLAVEVNAPLDDEAARFRGEAWNEAASRAQRRLLAAADLVICVSEELVPYAVARGARPERVLVLPNGVDVERFGRGRRLARFDDGKLNVLWVGRVEPRNGLDRMLAAFAELRRSVEARLLVVGDGLLLPRYQAMVPDELSEDVVFAGKLLHERPDWYASAHVYCATTSIASFGITLLEAMAAGKPILASDIDGFREVITHGKEGELLPVEDTHAWSRALCRLAQEPVRALAYAERGKQSVQRYAWPRITSEVLGLYRSIGVAG